VKNVIAPFELKGPDTKDLDHIMPGRGKTPVQQAWEYANDAPGAKWVLVSNCVEIRLYGYGRGREAYEVFDLTQLDKPDELRRLWEILSAKQFLGDGTDRLLRETDAAHADITNRLYQEYKGLRDRLIRVPRRFGRRAEVDAWVGDRTCTKDTRPHSLHCLSRSGAVSCATNLLDSALKAAQRVRSATSLAQFPWALPSSR